MPKTSKTRRRKPTQTRARTSCEAILQAATQILEREGEHAFNTNRVAEEAGVSIGTLYQYYASKRDILVALAHTEMEALYVKSAGITERHNDPALATRLVLRAFIQAFKNRPATRRAALNAILSAESPGTLGTEIDRTSGLLPTQTGMSRLDSFVLTRAVMGVVRAAILEQHPDLYTRKFENRLIKLIENYRNALA